MGDPPDIKCEHFPLDTIPTYISLMFSSWKSASIDIAFNTAPSSRITFHSNTHTHLHQVSQYNNKYPGCAHLKFCIKWKFVA